MSHLTIVDKSVTNYALTQRDQTKVTLAETCTLNDSPADYQHVESNLFQQADNILDDFFNNNSDIVSIFNYGSRSHPGISDLDLILIARDQPQAAAEIASQVIQLEHNLDRINVRNDATIMLLSESFYRQLPLIDTPNIECLQGVTPAQQSITPTQKSLRDITNLVEWIQWNLFKYGKMATQTTLNSGELLRFIKCLGFTLDTIYQQTDTTKHQQIGSTFAETAKNVRDLWLKARIPPEQLLAIADDHIEQIINRLPAVRDKFIALACTSEKKIKVAQNISFNHGKSWGLYQNKNHQLSPVIPAELMLPWSISATLKLGKLSENIRKNLSKTSQDILSANTDYVNYMETRMTSIYQHMQYVEQHAPSMGLFKMGWFR